MTRKEQARRREANRTRQAEFVDRMKAAGEKIVRVRAHVDDEARIKAYAAKLQRWRVDGAHRLTKSIRRPAWTTLESVPQ